MKANSAAGGLAVEWTRGGSQIVRFGGIKAGAQRAAEAANRSEMPLVAACPVILWDEVSAGISWALLA